MVSWVDGARWRVEELGLFGFVFLVRVGWDIVVSVWGTRGWVVFGVFGFGFVLHKANHRLHRFSQIDTDLKAGGKAKVEDRKWDGWFDWGWW